MGVLDPNARVCQLMACPTKKQRGRDQKGQALTAFIAFVGVFLVAVIGLFAFEISRYSLANSQLKNSLDAAALAASSTVAMYSATPADTRAVQTSYSDPVMARKAQTSAINVALKLFRQNSVLGRSLSDATLASGLPMRPAPNEGQIFLEFLSPDTNPPSVVALGDPHGKIIRVSAAYGVVPAFASFVPIPTVTATNSTTSAVPMLDLFNCFDVGGSMDDETKVTFIKRVWVATGPGSGYVDYQPVMGSSGGRAEGPLSRILQAPARGLNVNVLPPQGLENADTAPSPLKFSETQAATTNLRGNSNTGSPPGNHPTLGAPNRPTTGGSDTFTDLVANLDGNDTFGGTSVGGFNFPNTAVLVEAARGNLENIAVFRNAGLQGNPKFATISPRPGYKSCYENYAQMELQPLNTARNEALNFSYAMLHTNNCRIGEVSFNDNIGSTDLSTFSASNVSSAYTRGGTQRFLLPNCFERPVNDALFNGYKALCTSPAARNYGFTNDAGKAIDAAVDWLNNPIYHRPNADRAIVLFTNSAPADAQMTTARVAAAKARQSGIPVYVVGLSQRPATATIQGAEFDDSQIDPSSGGICGIAGHGGRYFQVTSLPDIPQAYGNIARQLVKLVPSQ